MRAKTYSGGYLDLENPHFADVSITDIAKGLSHQNRYGGQTHLPYTVAQHSVYVSYAYPSFMVQHRGWCLTPDQHRQAAFAGLMHDAAEAYIGDMMSPVKRTLPPFQALEDRLMRAIAERFNLDPGFLVQVAEVDERICVNEMHVLFKSGPYPELLRKYPEGVPGVHIDPVSAVDAEQLFLQRFKALVGDKREVNHA